MFNEAILIILNGGGDTEVKLIDAEWGDWFESNPVFPEGKTSITETAPDGSTIFVTTGSWDNDRALQIKGMSFGGVVEATEFALTNGVNIVNEYVGYIY